MAVHLRKSICSILRSSKWASTKYMSSFIHTSTKNFSDETDKKSDESTVASQHAKKLGFDKDHPVLVASHTDKCIVGCNCSSDNPTLKWFFIEEGPAQTCDCGYYFKLEKVSESQWIPEYSNIMQVDRTRKDPREERKGLPFKAATEPVAISPFQKPKIKAYK